MTSSTHRGNATDAELVRFFAEARDDGAFAELARRHGPMVTAVCRRVLSDAPEADDAAQAVWLVLAKRAGSLRDPERLGAWLHGVATRVALRARGRLARRRSRERPMPDSVAAGEVAPTSPDWAPVLDAELARLPEAFRTPLVLCELEGLARAEVATRLGIPEGTLASRLARGKAKLRARLVRRGVTLGAGGAGAILTEAKAAAGVLPASASLMTTHEGFLMLSPTLAKLLIPLLVAAGVATGLYFVVAPPPPPAVAKVAKPEGGAEPDPSAVLQEAQALARKGKYPEALEKHLWYHENSLRLDPAQSGVRLSFALSYWTDLGRKYPEAKVALVAVRDRELKRLTGGDDDADRFRDVAGINGYLKERSKTVELFKAIHAKDREFAGRCYFYAEADLVALGEYRLCRAYIPDPLARFEQMRERREMDLKRAAAADAADSARERESAEKRFHDQTRQLIEILAGASK